MNIFIIIVTGYDGSLETAGVFDCIEKATKAKDMLEKDSSRPFWEQLEIEETKINRVWYGDLDEII